MFQFQSIINALSFNTPEISEQAKKFFPEDTENFGSGLLQLIQKAFMAANPSLSEAAGICVSLFGIVILICLLNSISTSTKGIHELIGTVAVSLVLLQSTTSLINLGIDTVKQLNDYGKLLLPVMTAALAAQGGITSSTALYTGTVIFSTILNTLLTNLIIPLLYAYMALNIVNSAVDNELVKEISKFIKWLMTWILKIVLYVFTGYIGITGVVSGTADAAAIKATKLTLTGAVPVVGNIISDASETILISAGVVKNSAGILGLFVILALWVGPFLRIGAQYLLLKATAGFCGTFGEKTVCKLIKSFAGVLGFLLAVIGAMCLLLLISTVCFMRGMQ